MRIHSFSTRIVNWSGYAALVVIAMNCSNALAQPVIDRVFEDGFQTLTRSIRITPGAAVLTFSGADKSLTAEVLDSESEVIVAPVEWSSSRPEIVSVNGGVLTSAASTGSVVITATSPGATDAQIVVVVAEPAAGVQTLADSEIQGNPRAIDPDIPLGPGFQLAFDFTGAVIPGIGDRVVNLDGKPVAGEVSAVDESGAIPIITLDWVPLHELFSELNIEAEFDLSSLPIEVAPDLDSEYNAIRSSSGGLRLKRRAEKAAIPIGTSAFMLECESELSLFSQALSVAPADNIYIDPQLSLDFLYTANGLERMLVNGNINAVFELKPRLQIPINGTIKCKRQLGLIRVPLGGAFSLIFSGLVPLGVGFEMSAGITTTEPVGYDYTLSANAQPSFGIVCQPDCEVIKELNLSPPQSTFRPVLPDPAGNLADSIKVSLSVFGHLYASLSVGNPFIQALQFDALTAKAGVEQSLDLESETAQAANSGYASGFRLDLLAKIGLENSIQAFLDALDISLIPTGITICPTNGLDPECIPLARSPQGTMVIEGPSSTPQALPGETVTFTVTLDPQTYLTFNSIANVTIFEVSGSGSSTALSFVLAGDCLNVPADANGVMQCSAVYSESDVGSHRFVAMTRAKMFGFPIPIRLEIENSSERTLTISQPDDPTEPTLVFLGTEACAEIGDKDDSLVENCAEDEGLPSQSASASAGGGSAFAQAMAGVGTASINSSASSSTDDIYASGSGCAGFQLEFATVASRQLTVIPSASLSDSPGAEFTVFVEGCTVAGQNRGCENELRGSLEFSSSSDEPGNVSYADGIFEDYTGGSLTVPAGVGSQLNLLLCSGSLAEGTTQVTGSVSASIQ